MIDIKEKNFWLEIVKQWISPIIILPIVIYLIKNDGKIFVIDYINILIHEGGHGIFKIFGRFIYTLGGTIAQIVIPGMFVFYYSLKKKSAPLQLSLIWLGQNLINISIYASDARTQKLPLIGGNKVYHDWAYLLNEVGLMDYDQAIGMMFYSLAIASFIISLLIPFFFGSYKKSKINLEL